MKEEELKEVVDKPTVSGPISIPLYDEIVTRFTYHAPKGDQPKRYVYLRSQALLLATDILRNCPDSRERSLALTKLEEAIFWANASIARRES